jgi:hypothetical protein
MQTYDGFKVMPTAGGVGRVDAPSGPGAGQIAAQQQGQLAQAIEQAGAKGAQIATDALEQVNQVKVLDAVNKARSAANLLAYDPQQGYLSLKGDAALTRPSGQHLADEYGQKLQDQLDQIGQGLGNDRQRQLFTQAASQLRQGFAADAERHTLGEFQNFRASTLDGTAGLAVDSAKRNWNNPEKVQGALEAARAAITEKGQLLGKSAAETDWLREKTVSGVHHDVILAALENNNPTYALGYLDRNKDQMTADDILKVQGQVNQNVWAGQAMGAVQSAVGQFRAQIVPTDMDRMTQITLASESGGRRYDAKTGQLLTSSAGAKGEMQVLDGTNKDPGFGVKPAKNDSPEERARVGRDYLAAMVKRYGDAGKAWAAYNAGPGAVDDAVMRANASRTPGASWLTFMPNETQAYVAKNVKQLQDGTGAPPRPTESAFVDAALSKLPPGASPQVVQMTRQQAVQQFGIIDKSLTEAGNNAVAEAQRWLFGNNGNLDQMPASLRGAVVQFAPDKLDDLNSFAGKIAKGERVATDWGLYSQLTADPQLLKSTNLMAFRSKLADGEFKQLTERQTKLNNPSGDEMTRLQSARDVLNGYMRQAGIDPTPKDTDKDGAAKVGQLLSAFQQRIDAREASLGKKLDTVQLQEEAAQLFKPVKVTGTLWDSEAPAALVKPTERVTVPDAEARHIREALKRAGRPATDSAVQALYRAHHRIPQLSQAQN